MKCKTCKDKKEIITGFTTLDNKPPTKPCPKCNGTGKELEVLKQFSKKDIELVVDRCFHAYASSYRTEAVEMARELFEEQQNGGK